MFSKSNLVFLTKLILIISIFLPVVSVGAAGSIKLENKVENNATTNIFTSLDKLCVNGVFISEYGDISNKVSGIQSYYKGGLINVQPGTYEIKYPTDSNCSSISVPKLSIPVLKFHRYEASLSQNKLILVKDELVPDVSITTIDRKLVTGYSSAEIPTCIDNKLVSTLSNSSKMAFLTTTEDPSVPKITVGQHIISTYENDKCTDNSTTIDIQPNTWYIYEVPLTDGKTQVYQSSSEVPNKIIAPKSEPKVLLETVRTGGFDLNYYFILILILISLEGLHLLRKE